MMRIEHWRVLCGPYYKAPTRGFRLVGDVFGHPERIEGQRIHTTPIVATNAETETVETESGSVYKLGKVAPYYERAFPGARERVLRSYAAMETEVTDD